MFIVSKCIHICIDFTECVSKHHTHTYAHVVHTASISKRIQIQAQAYESKQCGILIIAFIQTHTYAHRLSFSSFWIAVSVRAISCEHILYSPIAAIEFSLMCNLWRSVWLMSIFQMYMYHRCVLPSHSLRTRMWCVMGCFVCCNFRIFVSPLLFCVWRSNNNNHDEDGDDKQYNNTAQKSDPKYSN